MDEKEIKFVDSAGNVVPPPPEHKDETQPKLPVLPKGLRDWTDNEVRYTGDVEDMNERIIFKLYGVWCLWSSLHENATLHEKLMEKSEEDSELYAMKHLVVDILDALGKKLSDTDIVKEILFLSENKK